LAKQRTRTPAGRTRPYVAGGVSKEERLRGVDPERVQRPLHQEWVGLQVGDVVRTAARENGDELGPAVAFKERDDRLVGVVADDRGRQAAMSDEVEAVGGVSARGAASNCVDLGACTGFLDRREVLGTVLKEIAQDRQGQWSQRSPAAGPALRPPRAPCRGALVERRWHQSGERAVEVEQERLGVGEEFGRGGHWCPTGGVA
jgi:hypothetical protein